MFMLRSKILNVHHYNNQTIYDCTIDRVESQVNKIFVSGWVVGKSYPAVSIDIVKKSRVIQTAKISIHRPGVAKKYEGLEGSEKSGFEIEIELAQFSVGTYEILLQAVFTNKNTALIGVIETECYDYQPQKKTFFIHVGKTGGTSFNHFLQTHLIGKVHCEVYRINSLINNGFEELEFLRSLEFISGHLMLKEFIENFNRSDYLLVTILRNPAAQLISHLNWIIYISHDTESRLFKYTPVVFQNLSIKLRKIKPKTTKELIEIFLKNSMIFMNYQIEYFRNDDELNSQKIINYLSEFDLVGVTEYYQDFLRKYTELIDLPIEYTVNKENQSLSPFVDKKSLLGDPKFIDFAKEYNSIEYEVYEYFLRQFS